MIGFKHTITILTHVACVAQVIGFKRTKTVLTLVACGAHMIGFKRTKTILISIILHPPLLAIVSPQELVLRKVEGMIGECE